MTDDESPVRVWLPAAPDLSNALLSSQRQNLYCDVVLRTEGRGMAFDKHRKSGAANFSEPASVSAHKVVLAAASPFFQEEIEKLSNDVIQLPSSVDGSTIKIIVEWMYGGLKEIEASKESLSRLYAISEELQLFSLVDALRDWIGDSRTDSDRVDSFDGNYEVGNPEDPTTLEQDAYDDLDDLAVFDDVKVKREIDEIEDEEEKTRHHITNTERFLKCLLKSPSNDSTKQLASQLVKKKEIPSKLKAESKVKLPPRKREKRIRNRKKVKKETEAVPVAAPKEVKKVDIHADSILSPLVDDDFVFRCGEPACGEVINRDSPGTSGSGNLRLFARRCAKHLWVHHRIVCPSVYKRCEEANCEYAGLDHDLARHTMYKHRKEKIACNICGRLVQENSLRNHIDLMHSDAQDEFTCSVCGKSFSRKHFLTLHENQRHKKGDELVRRCELCHYETAYKPMLVQHVFSRHNILLPGAKLFTCDLCGVFKTPLLKLLNRHKRRKKECNKGAAAPEPISCDLCGKVVGGPYQLKTHKHRMHDDADVSTCPLCGETFRSKSGIKYHLWRVHHQGNNGYASADVQFQMEKPFRCAYCPHASGLSGNCRKHIARAHPGLEVKYIDLRTMATAERVAESTDSMASSDPITATVTTRMCKLKPAVPTDLSQPSTPIDLASASSYAPSINTVTSSIHDTGFKTSSIIDAPQTETSPLPGLLRFASQLSARSGVKIPIGHGIPPDNDTMKLASQFLAEVNGNAIAGDRDDDGPSSNNYN